MTGWRVRHPGIGVLGYDSEAEARIAAGTAGEVLPPVYTLHIPVPDGGWLALVQPHEETERVALARAWADSAREAYRSADRSGWPRAPFAQVVFCPQVRAEKGKQGLHHPWDLGPTWNVVHGVLGVLGYDVPHAELVFGESTGDEAEPRMRVEFSEGVRRGS